MKLLVTLVFICMLLPEAVFGGMCYTCDVTNCNSYKMTICPSGYDYCLTTSANLLGLSLVTKTCATKEICDVPQSIIPGVNIGNVKCCQGLLCNGAESFTQSFLLMFIPLLSSILFY